MSTDNTLIQMKKLNKVFNTDGNKTSALIDVDLTIYKGDYLSIQGPSGGGKSTLLSIIGLLDQASDGEYLISDVAVTSLNPAQMAKVRNREIGFIFQDFNLIGDMTVRQNVELPLIYRGISKDKRQTMVSDVLKKVNMSERMDHLPGQLSGGQQQRVAVARAIVGKPALLLADEPTGNLDSINGDAVMQLLADLNKEGVTICMVTHDSRYADYAKRVVHLFDGKIQQEVSSVEFVSSLAEQNIAEAV